MVVNATGRTSYGIILLNMDIMRQTTLAVISWYEVLDENNNR